MNLVQNDGAVFTFLSGKQPPLPKVRTLKKTDYSVKNSGPIITFCSLMNTQLPASSKMNSKPPRAPKAVAENSLGQREKEVYLGMDEHYCVIEKNSVKLTDNFSIHLYPNHKVIEILASIPKDSSTEKVSELLMESFKSGNLQQSVDTTLYLDEDSIDNRVSTILMNNIHRKENNCPLSDQNYIFVIDRLGRLIIERKRTTPYGRIQHSSITRGRSVKAAGVIEVITDLENKKRYFYITNLSGHYKPEPGNLVHIEKLFAATLFKKQEDYIVFSEGRLVRTIKYSVDISNVKGG